MTAFLVFLFVNRYLQPWIQTVLMSGRCAVNVWGAITKHGLGPLVRIEGRFVAESYCAILRDQLLPYLLDGPFQDGCFLLQHDRSPVHTARSVTSLLEELCIRTLEWPPVGADLNAIENVWGIMKHRLAARHLGNCSADNLWTIIKTEWEELRAQADLVSTLYESMPTRAAGVAGVGGNFTKY